MSDTAPGISVFNKIDECGILQNDEIYLFSVMK
jgi:hypothetical protein